MDIEIAALCDAATDQRGKLNILGTFDTINTGQFPMDHPQCAIAYRIRFSADEAGEHRFKVNFVDQDGTSFMPSLDHKLMVQIPPGRDYTVANVILNVRPLHIKQAGTYRIDLAIDDVPRRALLLYCVEAKRG